MYIYPGIDGPIDSIRMSNTRDGIEDYEYLVALAKKAGDIEVARKACEKAVWALRKRPLSFSYDPAVLEAARDDIARALTAK